MNNETLIKILESFPKTLEIKEVYVYRHMENSISIKWEKVDTLEQPTAPVKLTPEDIKKIVWVLCNEPTDREAVLNKMIVALLKKELATMKEGGK